MDRRSWPKFSMNMFIIMRYTAYAWAAVCPVILGKLSRLSFPSAIFLAGISFIPSLILLFFSKAAADVFIALTLIYCYIMGCSLKRRQTQQ